jgi:amino acid adenylation domain-containing protein
MPADPSVHPLRPKASSYVGVCARVAAAARQSPHAVALVSGAVEVRYGAFEAKANRLARYLLSLGLSAGQTMAVYLPRSIDQIICVAAAMKIGACFLPLDPSWPSLRAHAVVEDAHAHLVIGSGAGVRDFETAARRVVDLDAEAADIAACAAADVVPEVGPDDIAYLIFTSGSTGGPKGAEIGCGSFDHLVAWKAESFCLRPGDRVSHGAGVAFDGALTEVWPALSVGATVVLVDEAARVSAERLRDWYLQESITVAALVPPVLAERLIVMAWPEATPLRMMMSAGEALRVYPAPGLPFFVLNGYGPTECAVEATLGLVPTEAGMSTAPPIGRPIPGVEVYILGAAGERLPAGEVGEIHIGGLSVGCGYRNRPEETVRRFLSDPFSAARGARMFRTGDLGAYQADGQLTFHGRLDDQLQIRGYRVEPGEVASALARHPLVASCAVAPMQGRQGEELVAYIVCSRSAAPSASDLQEFLSERLPLYMLPSAYVRLDALPLTPNGKVDRAALPPPEGAEVLRGPTSRPPESVAEVRLAQIFGEVLKRAEVGADDDFFLIGGHSLLAAEVTERASEAFGLDLKLQLLFEARTVRGYALALEAQLIAALEAMSEEAAAAATQAPVAVRA